LSSGPGLETEETIPARLSVRLGPRVEVINAGVPGMSIKDEVDLLDEVIDDIDPDLVLLGFYMNDPIRSMVIEEEYGDLDETLVRAVTRGRRLSAIFNRAWEGMRARELIKIHRLGTEWVGPFHQRRWISERKVFDDIIELSGDDFGAAWKRESWTVIESEVKRLIEVCGRTGCVPVIIMLPVSLQVQADFVDDYPQRRMGEVVEKYDLQLLDLLPLLRQYRDQPILYDQCHYTPRGADLVAGLAADWLLNKRLIY
jgi:hypothetical protein